MKCQKSLVLFYIVSNFLMILSTDDSHSSPNINYMQYFIYNTNHCLIKDVNQLVLAKTLKSWHFDENQILLKTFPLDQEKSNFVREVRNVLFSSVKPTALQSKLKLAAVSDHTLEHILDIDAEAISSDEEFLQVVYLNRRTIQ